MADATSIVSHGIVASRPMESYGSGIVLLRLGNGGAGATGLLKALALDYLDAENRDGSIQWIANHSRNTQLALQRGYIDIALTYERDQEQVSVDEGWAVSAGCVFHDHFCLAGPIGDPAGIKACPSVREALQTLASREQLFHSRADFSATMFKERSLWSSQNLKPWEEMPRWYKTSELGPGDALQRADSEGAYTLTDRSTFLRQVSLGRIKNNTVYFEPVGPDDVLMNSCYALVSPNAPAQVMQEARQFLQYVRAGRGTRIVSRYGSLEAGMPLFANVHEQYARTSLVGGRALHGKWVVV